MREAVDLVERLRRAGAAEAWREAAPGATAGPGDALAGRAVLGPHPASWRPGRRPGSRVTWTRLPDDVAEALARLAVRQGRSRSGIVAEAVATMLQELGELDGDRARDEILVDPFAEGP